MSRYDIAIIGMGGVFPSANNLDQYWKNIESGDTFFSQMPKHLWHLEHYYSENKGSPEKTYTLVGSFIKDFEFPFLDYRLPPNALKGVDPTQLVTLEATREALNDAGIEPRSSVLDDGITVIGASGVDAFAHSSAFLRRHRFTKHLRPLLKEQGVPDATLERLEAQFAQVLDSRGHVWNPAIAAVGAIVSSVSNRVAQVFGLGGFNLTLDGACASSFSALETACHALMAGDTNIAIAGGADLGTNPPIYVGFARVDGLSSSGMANPFDNTADGLVIGEGVGVVVLKRLEDAVRDGDNVRAVIRGIGASSDGAGQAIYAPSVEGRAEALQSALEISETDPQEVQFIEAHATSTIVGDANEYDAISTVYSEGRTIDNPLCLGSVKGQIGHLKAAAGMAGLVKTVLAMDHGIMPHMPRFKQLTPGATKPNDAFQIPTETGPWNPRENGKRVAAVTTSGFGGVNYHAIIEQAEAYEPPKSRPQNERDIAIVGVSLNVAGATDVDQFWENVTSGKDVFTDVDPAELGWEDHLDTGPASERITTRKVSRIKGHNLNLLKHKIFPTAVSQISPTQLLGLDLADRLLEKAGYSLPDPKNIGVSVGCMHDDNYPDIFTPMLADEYISAILECEAAGEIDSSALENHLQTAGAKLRECGPPVTEHTLPGWMTNVIAGRMANKLNLHGPNFTVDSACSSGVSSLLPAMYQLMYNKVDAMISGGLNQQLSDVFTAGVCGIGAIAESIPRPFDAEGKGFLIGEGGVLLLLKRRADAERDGDDIFGVIHSVSGSSESDSKSMIAPSEEAIRRSIRNTLELCDIPESSIGVVDTHGSANLLSDLVEARSLAAELRENTNATPVQITAIKSHIGHLYGGSGTASLLSTLMSLRTRQVPGIRNLSNPRPEIADLTDRVQPRHGTEPLAESITAGGVNSLGLGGANYFAVISAPNEGESMTVTSNNQQNLNTNAGASARPSMRADDDLTTNLFVCLADYPEDLAAGLGRAVQQSPIPQFISEGNQPAVRMAITFGDQSELKNKINSALKMIGGGHQLSPLESQGIFVSSPSDAPAETLAFCFPGQGTHYISMGKKLYADNPVFRGVLDEVHDLAMKSFNFDLLGHIHGDENDKDIARMLGTLAGAQTSLFAVELAMAKVIESMGILPTVMIGHSFGEISALTFAGVWDVATGFKVVEARIKAAEQIINSGGPALGMMSLISSDEQRDALIKMSAGKVVLTNINAPGRFVLAGEKDAVAQIADVADSFGAEARVLPIGAAFHSAWMEPAVEPFRAALAKLPASNPRFPILSTVTGEYIDMEGMTSDKIAKHLSGQLTTPLNLPREINRLHAEGTRHFLEIGPGWSLTKMMGVILDGREYRAHHTLHPKVGDEETFRRARAFLMALGHLHSAVERQNLPGMFSDDFIQYLENEEPAVVALLSETHRRYVKVVTTDSMYAAGANIERRRPEVATPVARTAPATVTVPAKPAAKAPAVATMVDTATWVERVREKLVQTTGYPADMLEEELDLEADLGVDSVQRAEIWMALTGEYGLDQEARPSGVRNIAQLAQSLAEIAGSSAAGIVETPNATQPTAAVVDTATWVERVREKLVQTTGYPADMLEEELDLEADLGVDSVQRAEIWMALTGEYGLDQEARPSGVRNIAQLAQSLAEIAGASAASATTAPVSPSAAPAATGGTELAVWVERVREKLVQTTGYPADMLEEELDLEADLGVDSVQRAEIWMALTGEHGLDQEARPSSVRNIAQLAESLRTIESSTAAPAQPPAAATAEPQPTAAPAPAAAAPAVANGDVSTWVERVREKLVQTTGYPAEMLEEELDLEADLGVDSVQRAEIWMALTGEHGLDKEARPSGVRTISQLAQSLLEIAASGNASTGAPAIAEKKTEKKAVDENELNRLFSAGSEPIVEGDLEPFSCKEVLIVAGNDTKFADRFNKKLAKSNVDATILSSEELTARTEAQLGKLLTACDTIYYVGHYNLLGAAPNSRKLEERVLTETTRIYDVFKKLSGILASQPKRVVFPVSQDGSFGASCGDAHNLLGAFPAGFVRSLRRELNDCRFQLIDTGNTSWDDALADHAHKCWPGIEMGLAATGRVVPTLARLAPAIEHLPVLESGDLVLVTGGARGIVFECVAALAQRTGCKLLLTGRTGLPKGQPKYLEATPANIDQVIRDFEIELVKSQGMALGAAKREGVKARSSWELHRNLKRLREMGIQASYEICDVSDPTELKKLARKVSKKETIRGVVHGAGVQKGRLITDLTQEEIMSVVGTKLSPLFALIEVLDLAELKLFNGFGSIAGVFGNPGQTDYGLANDLLGWVIQSVGAAYPQMHTQTINWTAWTGTGMVSKEEAKRFVESGLTPLDVESGVNLFIEGVTGTQLGLLNAFNAGAQFAAERKMSAFPVAPRRRASLLESDANDALIRFNNDEDIYLGQHLVQDLPVVPGTFITEVFNETSSREGLVPADIRFRRPLSVRDSELQVEAVRTGEALSLLPAIRPDKLNEQALSNLAFATCRLAKPGQVHSRELDFTPDVLKKLKAAAFNGGAPFYSVLDQRFSHILKSGPIFRGIRSTLEENELFYGLVSITDEAAALLEMPGQFIWNPVLADMAVQVAAAWSIHRNDTMAIPASISNVHIESTSVEREAVVICSAHSLTPNETIVDVAVRELNGDLILSMDKLVLRTIPG